MFGSEERCVWAYRWRTWRCFSPGSRTHSSASPPPSSRTGWSRIGPTSPLAASVLMLTDRLEEPEWMELLCPGPLSSGRLLTAPGTAVPWFSLTLPLQSAGHQVHTPRGGAFTACQEGGGGRNVWPGPPTSSGACRIFFFKRVARWSHWKSWGCTIKSKSHCLLGVLSCWCVQARWKTMQRVEEFSIYCYHVHRLIFIDLTFWVPLQSCFNVVCVVDQLFFKAHSRQMCSLIWSATFIVGKKRFSGNKSTQV